MPRFIPLLAEITADQRLQAMMWVVAVLVCIAVSVVVLLWLRRMLFGQDEQETGLMTMDQLIRLREEGKITQSEYETIRQTIIDQMRSGMVH